MSSLSFIRDLQQNQHNYNGWTNAIIFHQHKHKISYFVPAYMRIKCKNFVSMDINHLLGTANIDLIFTVFYGNLPEVVVNYLQTHIVLRFNKGKSFRLKQDQNIQLSKNQIEKTFRFTVRKLVTAQLDVDILWSPFQIINYVISIAISKIRIPDSNIQINFNLMENKQNKFMQANYTQDSYFGEYDLAQNLIQVQYSNWSFYSKLQAAKSQTKQLSYLKYKEKFKFDIYESAKFLNNENSNIQYLSQSSDLKIEAYHYAHFVFPLYRKPFITLVKLFFPVVLLAIINLAIFFQNGIAKKIQNLAIVLVAYVALIPTIRGSLPPNDKITFSEVLIFAFAFTTMLTFIQTIETRNIQNFKQNWTNDGYFLAAFGITIGGTFLLIYMSLVHLMYYQVVYNREVQKQDFKFIRYQWSNKKCDQYFKKAVLNGYEVKVVQKNSTQIARMILQI